ncbi:putative C2 domain, von Willebrand factor, type A, copine, protein BONZAI, C2 domain superfamily [Helianthus annuus]|nr:putative C2 domain, von Willebrand factor, type A, copine, protein BONZAI, C2 domain superfamily [Helianthus annuus]
MILQNTYSHIHQIGLSEPELYRMGGCFSDVSGGKEAVGGDGGGGGGGGHNLQYQRGLSSNVVVSSSSTAVTDEAVDHFYLSKGLQPLYTRIESDPMAVVYAKNKKGILEEVGRTEVIMNSLNPIWIQKISVVFHFEIVQPLVFKVYDVDTKYHNLSTKMLDLKEQDYVGEANCVLSEIMTQRSRSMTLKLRGRNGHDVGNLGSITIRAEETIASKMAVEMRLRCSNLDNKDRFSKSDPFLRISRVVETGSPIPICKTEVVNNNLDPVWKPLCINTQQYVSKDNPLVIECFDFNSNGNHTLIGKLQTSIQGMENLYKAKVGANFVIPSSRHKDNEKVLKGKLYVEGYEEKELYSFLDYISSGFELNFMVAVDFTASNGDPRSPTSLHYIDYSGRLNAYQQAIMEVGEVIQFYDYDKRFPAWGFGGKLYDGSVSHCFNLSGNAGSFEVEGVQGIMDAYKNALHTVSLHGPTLFGQVVNQAAEIAAQSLSTNPTKYFILLIITDGVLTDLQETKDAIVRASDLPLSILIVGVGNADFKQMEILDADTGPRLESSTGRIATRDNVQFVPVRDVQHGERSMVQALLEELPGQFLTYMRSRDVKPLGIDVRQTPIPSAPLIT